MSSHPAETSAYYRLDPDAVLQAVESLGLRCDGRLLALNSYENRVYQVGREEGEPLVAKFYRPLRWSDAQIREEHAFALELAEAEIPLVAPLRFDGETLHERDGYRFALFPRRGGREPEPGDPDTLRWLGRFLGRIHAVGAARPFAERPAMDLESMGREAIQVLWDGQWLPAHLETAFFSLAEDLMKEVAALAGRAGSYARLRIHGDCHPGNILWRDGPFFVDLDDCRSGPAVQDLWMLLSGEAEEMTVQLGHLLEGYTAFHPFDPRELHLVEALRTLRMLHYAAWIAQRWEDPAFPRTFPWFEENRYWEQLILDLREQFSRMQAPALELPRWGHSRLIS